MNIKATLYTVAVLAAALAMTMFSDPVFAEWGPPQIAVQGVLTNLADEPVEGPVNLLFSIYQSKDSINPAWSELHSGVALADGRFDLLLGVKKPLDSPPLFEQFDSLWVGVSIDGGAELPRAPLSSVGYAMQARHAVYCDELSGPVANVDCDGCVSSGDIEDAGITFADFGPNNCGAGQVMKRSENNDAWVCADDSDTGYGEGEGVDISNGVLSLDFALLDMLFVNEEQPGAVSTGMLQDGAVTDAKVANVSWSKLLNIPPGFLDGQDDVGLLVEADPTVGTLEDGKWCTSDGEEITCQQPAPTMDEEDPQVGANNINYVPFFNGLALVAGSIFDNGNIGIGTSDPGGKLHVAGGLTRIGTAGDPDAADGDGDLFVQHDLEVDGHVSLGGPVDMTDHKIENLDAPENGTDAVNKDYVDATVATAVSGVNTSGGEKQRYTIVLAVRTGSHCPPGYTSETRDSVAGPNGNLYVNIHQGGLFMGGMNGLGYGDHQIYARVPSSQGIQKICWKSYESSSGRPHTSFYAFQGGNADSCPANYHYIPRTELAGNNGWVYMLSNDSGMFLGYRDDWSFTAHTHKDESGYMARSFSTHADTVCFKVMGVDDDETTKDGVFPVYLGVSTTNACPQGWNIQSVSAADGANGNFYLQINDSMTASGGISDWWTGGNHQMNVHFHYSMVNYVCWNFFNRTAKPFAQIRTPHQGTCPNGYMSFNAAELKGSNNNGYISMHSSGLYMGGITGWGSHDYNEGWIRHNFTSEVNNKVCLKLENVK